MISCYFFIYLIFNLFYINECIDEDWIDPLDMNNYNHNTKQMNKNDWNNLNKCENYNKDKEILIYYKRLINNILNNYKQGSLKPNEIMIELSENHYEIIQDFLKNDNEDYQLRDIDNILTDSLRPLTYMEYGNKLFASFLDNLKLINFNLRNIEENCLYKYLPAVLLILTVLKRLSFSNAFFLYSTTLLVFSHLYSYNTLKEVKLKEQWIKLKDDPNIPSYCKLQDSFSSSECENYYQIDDKLNPVDVLLQTIRNFFTQIASIFGESFRKFTDESLANDSFLTNIIMRTLIGYLLPIILFFSFIKCLFDGTLISYFKKGVSHESKNESTNSNQQSLPNISFDNLPQKTPSVQFNIYSNSEKTFDRIQELQRHPSLSSTNTDEDSDLAISLKNQIDSVKGILKKISTDEETICKNINEMSLGELIIYAQELQTSNEIHDDLKPIEEPVSST